jgi:hypothetical protein
MHVSKRKGQTPYCLAVNRKALDLNHKALDLRKSVNGSHHALVGAQPPTLHGPRTTRESISICASLAIVESRSIAHKARTLWKPRAW